MSLNIKKEEKKRKGSETAINNTSIFFNLKILFNLKKFFMVYILHKNINNYYINVCAKRLIFINLKNSFINKTIVKRNS